MSGLLITLALACGRDDSIPYGVTTIKSPEEKAGLSLKEREAMARQEAVYARYATEAIVNIEKAIAGVREDDTEPTYDSSWRTFSYRQGFFSTALAVTCGVEKKVSLQDQNVLSGMTYGKLHNAYNGFIVTVPLASAGPIIQGFVKEHCDPINVEEEASAGIELLGNGADEDEADHGADDPSHPCYNVKPPVKLENGMYAGNGCW